MIFTISMIKIEKNVDIVIFLFREQRVKARRNNKEMLKHEIQFMSNYLEGSRVKTSQVAESKNQLEIQSWCDNLHGRYQLSIKEDRGCCMLWVFTGPFYSRNRKVPYCALPRIGMIKLVVLVGPTLSIFCEWKIILCDSSWQFIWSSFASIEDNWKLWLKSFLFRFVGLHGHLHWVGSSPGRMRPFKPLDIRRQQLLGTEQGYVSSLLITDTDHSNYSLKQHEKLGLYK